MPTVPMIFKDGDMVVFDGERYLVQTVDPNGYWIKNADGGNSYYYMMYKSKEDIDDLFKNGRIRLDSSVPSASGGSSLHTHHWQRYMGLNLVEDYCDCGAKRPISWQEVGKQ